MSSAAEPQKQNALPLAKPSRRRNPPSGKEPQQVVIELQRAELLRAVYSNRQLYESVVNFGKIISVSFLKRTLIECF